MEKDIHNFEMLITEPTRLVFQGGYVLVPDRPGIGIELDPESLMRFAISH